jgi:hypothetical protein
VIGQLRQAISGATSHQDLASRLAALPIPQSGTTSPADLALPFPQRQRNLLEGLARSERAAAVPSLGLLDGPVTNRFDEEDWQW